MYLENLVFDAVDPQRLGRFWEAAVGGERLTDKPDQFETRLAIEGTPALDLCFQRAPEPPAEPLRLHLDLYGGAYRDDEVERLIALGAQHLDVGQGDVPWTVLADPEGNPFCVMPHRTEYVDTGPIAALPLDAADPERDARFWSWLTGWARVDGVPTPILARTPTLRHPSRRGPLLALCTEPEPKGTAKNRLHLDVRLEADEDADEVAAGISARGGRELDFGGGELPWRITPTRPATSSACFPPARRTRPDRRAAAARGPWRRTARAP